MRILVFESNTEIDTPKAVGSALVAAGLAAEVPTGPTTFVAPLPCKQEATFTVQALTSSGEPCIRASCTCNPTVDYMGPTADNKARFLHRGGKVDVPSRDVRKTFKLAHRKHQNPPEPELNPDRTPGKTITIHV